MGWGDELLATGIGTPGRRRPHPRHEVQKLFDRLLIEATEAGYGIDRYRVEPFGQYNIRAGR